MSLNILYLTMCEIELVFVISLLATFIIPSILCTYDGMNNSPECVLIIIIIVVLLLFVDYTCMHMNGLLYFINRVLESLP